MSLFFSKSVLDRNWSGHAFLVTSQTLTVKSAYRRRNYTTSSRKFIDTTLGGHFAINPLSQFTANCDIVHDNTYKHSTGVGRWWSEKIDDNAQFIHIRCGVPKYNTMSNFLMNFYNVQAGNVSRTGRATNVWFRLGQAAGFIGTLPLQPFILGGQMLNFFLGMPKGKFYYHKPTMYPYWTAVSSLCNTYLVNRGMTSYFQSDGNKEFYDPVLLPGELEQKAQSRIYDGHAILSGGAIDIFALSTKAQRLANAYRTSVDNAMEGAMKDLEKAQKPYDSNAGYIEARENLRSNALEGVLTKYLDDVIGGLPAADSILTVERNEESRSTGPGDTLYDYEDNWVKTGGDATGYADDKAEDIQAELDEVAELVTERQGTTPEGEKVSGNYVSTGLLSRLTSAFHAERKMGADFVTLMISNTGTHSESFSNSFKESGLQQSFNSTSSQARSARFNMAEGNLGIPGMDTAINMVKSFASGVLDSAQAGGLMALAGSSFVDIQKVYDSSSSSMMDLSLTIPLRTWAADEWLVFKRIIYPLFCIAAFSMPRATGPASYDEPFLLEVFLRGRSQMRECRVSSFNITRGVGDVGWTRDGIALGIDVSITLENMSGVFGVPINPTTSKIMAAAGILGDSVEAVAATLSKSTYSEDNQLGDYQAVLAAVSLENQINTFKKWKLALARTRASMSAWRSPDRTMAAIFDTLPGELIKAISAPTERN